VVIVIDGRSFHSVAAGIGFSSSLATIDFTGLAPAGCSRRFIPVHTLFASNTPGREQP